MLIYREWSNVKHKDYYKITKVYKALFLFGIIPLWVHVKKFEER